MRVTPRVTSQPSLLGRFMGLPVAVQALLAFGVVGLVALAWVAVAGVPTPLDPDAELITAYFAQADGVTEKVEQIKPSPDAQPPGVRTYFVRTSLTLFGSPTHNIYRCVIKDGAILSCDEWLHEVKW